MCPHPIQFLRILQFGQNIFLLTILFCLFHTPLLAASEQFPPQKTILIIHSYHKGLSWTDNIEDSIRDGLSDLPDTRIFTEYLDSKRQDLATAQGPFGRYLRARYMNLRPDLIIVSDNNALTFLRSQPVDDFIGVPIIFCGINNFSHEMLEGLTPQITGIVEEVDPEGTVRIISQLQPNSKRLILISGSTPTAAHVKEQTEKVLASMKTDFNIEWWHNLDSNSLLNRLSILDKNDAVLLLLFNRDQSGNYYSYKKSGQLITSATNAPVYGLWDFYLGTGVVGGRMASSRDQGETAAILAHRYFKEGTLPGILTSSPNATLFNAQALQAHGIKETSLPPDARIVGALPNQRPLLFATLGSALLIGLLIVAILFMLSPLFSMKTKLTAIINRSVISIAGGFILFLLLTLVAEKCMEYQRFINLRHQQLLSAKKQTLVMMVQQAVNLIELGRRQNSQSLKELQQKLLQQISALSFQDSGDYLFVLDYDGTVLSHPANPTLIGKDISTLRDSDGVFPAREIIRIAKGSEGSFVSYLWPKPDRPKPVPKLSYAQGVDDWEWAIASGVYLDDIDILLDQEKNNQRHFFLQELTFLIITSILGLITLYLISKRLSHEVKGEIASLEQGLRDQNAESEKLAADQYQIHEFSHIASAVRNAFSALAHANAELRASEQQFLDALQSSPDAMLLIDNESFIDCNQPAATMLGYTDPNQLLNLHPSQISPPQQPDKQDSASKAEEMIAITISQGTNRFEWQHLRKDGSPIPIEVTLTLSPVTVSKTKTVLQCIWRDLTLEKKLAAQMHQVEEQRQASLEESERMNSLMTGREERIIEIKEEVNTLLSELGRKTKYGHNKDVAAIHQQNGSTGEDKA